MSPRDWVATNCNDCGSWYETFYDRANDYYMCKECVEKEEDAPEVEDEEEE